MGGDVSFTDREWWGLIHGMGLGALFLLSFAGGLAGLYSLRPALITPEGLVERMRRLKVGVVTMAVVAWGTVITGTWIVYPWYREQVAGEDLAACEGLSVPDPETCSPRDFLLSDTSGETSDWHEFGMEWKEHVAWISPILATVVAFIVLYYGTNLIRHDRVRRTAIALYVLAFGFAAIAGALGAFITKVAPVK
jgi:hypothetical protein